ncbi:hypothetical protein OROHE_015115 [Orobanche hederae]
MAGSTGGRGSAGRGSGTGRDFIGSVRLFSSHIPPPPPQKKCDSLDSGSEIIELIPFDHHTGNYEDIVVALRKIFLYEFGIENAVPKPIPIFSESTFLVIIMVMQMDGKLPIGITLFMQNWSHMSAVARHERADNGYRPPDILDLDDADHAKLMLDSKLGAQKVIAFHHRGKNI